MYSLEQRQKVLLQEEKDLLVARLEKQLAGQKQELGRLQNTHEQV